MNRRGFLLGALGLGAGVALLRPSDRGAPHEAYFATLNEELKPHGPMRPTLLIDLDRLDHNIDAVMRSVRPPKHYRMVEKSLPSLKLLEYIGKRSGSSRLMSFHQPFLNLDAAYFPQSDILLGKPLPVRSAELFYRLHKGSFDPARQLQWLLDTPERLAQYLALAEGLDTKLRINIEIDVGLHRGGVNNNAALGAMLSLIAVNPQRLEFAGFMGYDPHVGMLPGVLGSRESLLAEAMAIYQGFVDFTRAEFSALWGDGLTLNTAGSPTYKLHQAESLSNDISVGTGLLKPTHYDLETLTDHQPAVFIATPVLKATGAVQIPGLDEKSAVFSWWDPNQRETYFIYGGNWMAEYASPRGLQFNSIYGHSSNQEIVNASAATALRPDDQIFLRPTQTESVLLQFGDMIAVRGGKIQEYWPVFSA